HILDIQNNKWTGYKKPYISKTLKQILYLPKEEPSLIEIENTVEKLKESINSERTRIEEAIKELK
ncbi:12477_t:CDS:1, partial [Racocetra fulgida]